MKTPIVSAPKNLINGIAADFININDRVVHYGDGLFETILCAEQKIYYWALHYQRLKESAEKLNISCPLEQVLLDDIKSCLEGLDEPCAIKIIITRGNSKRGYRYDKTITGKRIVMISEITQDYSSLLKRQLLSGDLFLCEQQVSINKNLAGLKHLNRLENVLARNEWADEAFIDGLMLNHNSHVIEATMSNLFAIEDHRLMTPDLSLSGVNGIMRRVILNIADELNIKTVVENITLENIMKADELFISNSLIGIKSIDTFNDKTFGEPSVTKNIFDELISSVENNAKKLQ